MKNSLLFGILLLITASCKSTYTKIGDKKANYIPYYLKVYEADSLYSLKKYQNTHKVLENLFNKYEPINMVFYFEYEKYVSSMIQIDFKKNYRKELEFLVLNLGYTRQRISSNPLLMEALKKSNISLDYLDNLHQKYIDRLDLNFRKQLKNMYYEDQEVRKREGLSRVEQFELIEKTDKKNDFILRKYIENKGFPNDGKIGNYQIYSDETDGFSINLLLNHFSYYEDVFNYYNSVLPQFVKNGTCSPQDYAMLVDKRYINIYGKPYYYTWVNFLEEIKNKKEEIKRVNMLRKKIGLPTVEQQQILLNRIM